MLGTRKRFWELRSALVLQTFRKQESCFAVWADIWRRPRLSAALTENKTFRKF